jgi:hypothetical protein
MKNLTLILVCLFLFKNILVSQPNLIQNGSFENVANVDCYGGFYNGTLPNAHVLDYWYQYNSPDYFNSSCGAGGYSVPNSWFGYSPAKHGNAFVGFIGYAGIGTEAKEYLYQQFSTPLVNGKIYKLSFYVTLADASNGAIKNIGAYFCPSLPSLTGFSYINVVPQIVNQNGFLTDTLNWFEIQGLYTATGGEQYLIFGNFNSNANTDTINANTTSANTTSYPRYSYYYIDDITLIDQSTVGINELSNGASVNAFPNPANDVLNINVNTTKENLTIKITDVVGRDVLNIEYESHLDISFLEKGIYIVSLLQGNKTLVTKKIVKQ